MKQYESLCVFKPTCTEADVETFLEKWTSLVTSRGGTITKVDKLGLKRFAVPLKRLTEGWHVVWTFEAPPEAIAEVTRAFRMSDVIVRGMVSHLPVLPPPPPVPAAPPSPAPAAEATPA